jgi:hypothetical protein
MSEKLLDLLTEVRDACLYAEDGYIGITQEPHIDDDLFDRICAAINELRPPPISTD